MKTLSYLKTHGLSVCRRLLLIACFSHHFVCSAGERLPPRLWQGEIKSNNKITKFYILAATHIGLPVEYDDYFQNTVVPLFGTAQALHFEGAGNGQDEPFPVCDENSLTASGKLILKHMRAIVADRFFRELRRRKLENKVKDIRSIEVQKKIAKSYVDGLDEFGVMQLSNSLPVDVPSGGVGGNPWPTKGSVVDKLISLNPEVKIYDVDSKFGVKRAYCKASAERINYLRNIVVGDDVKKRNMPKNIEKLNLELIKIMRNDERINPNNSKLQFFQRSIICDRNVEWADQIVKLDDEINHFYVLGAGHIFDVEQDEIRCKGIIDLLKNRGVLMSIVH